MTDDNERCPIPLLDDRYRRIRSLTDPIAVRISSFLSSPPDDMYNDVGRRETALEEFKRAFASRSVEYTPILIIILLLLLNLSCRVEKFPNQIYGLAIDLFGAIILGRGLLLSPMGIVANATAGYGGPMPIFRANQALEATDGIWGISLLLLGIIIQGIAVTPFS